MSPARHSWAGRAWLEDSLARLLLNVPRVAKVDVVVRTHHADVAKLQALAAAQPDRLEVALEPAEITARVVRCHFALTSGSDNHGWGSTAPNWTLMLIFGWRGMAADSLESINLKAGILG